LFFSVISSFSPFSSLPFFILPFPVSRSFFFQPFPFILSFLVFICPYSFFPFIHYTPTPRATSSQLYQHQQACHFMKINTFVN
jgi:hypothetical protein